MSKKVVENILDTHLAIRIQENEWGPDFKIENAPATGPIREKLDADKKTALAMPLSEEIKDKTAKDWLEYIYKLGEVEASEKAIKTTVRAKPFNLHIGAVIAGPVSLTERAAHAARSYIASELVKNCKNKFEEAKTLHSNAYESFKKQLDVAKQVTGADKEHLQKLKLGMAEHQRKFDLLVSAESKKFHEIFFNTDIKKRDNRSKALKEETFADFCTHSIDGSRKHEYLTTLLAAPAPVAAAAPAPAVPTTPAPAATQPAPSVAKTGIYANSVATAKAEEIVKKENEKASYEYPAKEYTTRSKGYGNY